MPSVFAALSILTALSWRFLRPYFVFAWLCFFKPIGKKDGDQKHRLDSVRGDRVRLVGGAHGVYGSFTKVKQMVIPLHHHKTCSYHAYSL